MREFDRPCAIKSAQGDEILSERVRVLVVDDHEIVRRNICQFLSLHAEFEAACEASNGLEAIQQAERHQPDIILLDISLPQLSGLAALPQLRKVSPASKIIMVTNHDSPILVRNAFAAGALGFVTKSDLTKELITAIREVRENRQFLSKSMKEPPEPVPPTDPSPSGAEA